MKKVFVLLALVGLFSVSALAENKVSIKGTVCENNENKNTPICMAYVYVNNTVYCTYTDQNGNFELELPKGKHSVKIAFKGYTTKTRVINTKKIKNIDIILEPNNCLADKK